MCCSFEDDIYTNSMRMGNLTAPNSLPELADHLCPGLVTSRPWHCGLVEAQHNTSADLCALYWTRLSLGAGLPSSAS